MENTYANAVMGRSITRSAFASLFLTVFLDSFGFMMVFSYMYFFATSLGATPLVYGSLIAIYAVMQLVFSPILGRISDRFGRRKVLLISTFGTGLSLLAFGLSRSIAQLFIARAISGIMGATFPVAQAYVSDTTSNETRLRNMGFLGAGLGLGLAIGPALGGILSTAFGYEVPALFAAAIGFVNFALVFFRLPEPPHAINDRNGSMSAMSLFSDRGIKFLLGTYLAFFVAFLVMTTTYSPWAYDRLNFGPLQVGLSLFYIGTLLVVVQGALIPRISTRIPPPVLLVFGLASFAAGLGALASTSAVPGLVAATTLLAVGYGFSVPSMGAMLSIMTSANSRGVTFGAAQSLQGGAQVVSPILGNSVFAVGAGLGLYGLSFITSLIIVLPSLGFGAIMARNSTFLALRPDRLRRPLHT